MVELMVREVRSLWFLQWNHLPWPAKQNLTKRIKAAQMSNPDFSGLIYRAGST